MLAQTRIVLRQLNRNWISSTFVVLCAAVGITAVTFSLGVLFDQTLRTVTMSNPEASATVRIHFAKTRPTPERPAWEATGLPKASVIKLIHDTTHIKAAQLFPTNVKASGRPGSPVMTATEVVGALWSPPLLHGRYLQPRDMNAAVVVVGQQVAQSWFDTREVLGESVALEHEGKPLGVFKVIGVMGIPGKLTSWDNAVYMPLSYAPDSPITGLELVAERPSDVQQAYESFGHQLSALSSPVVAHRPDRVIQGEPPQLIVEGALTLLSLTILLVSSINSGNLALLWVLRRQREIAIRIALGATPLSIWRLILSEAFLLNSAGLLVGLGLYGLLWLQLRRYMSISFSWTHLLAGAVGLLLSVLLSASIPARFLSRLSPAKALRAV